MSRDNKDSRKIVGDTINTRAEMKTRRESLLKRSSQRLRSALSKTGSVDSARSVKSKTDDEKEEKASWPQTIIFPEGKCPRKYLSINWKKNKRKLLN